METITKKFDIDGYQLGDPEVARKLRLLAKYLPDYPGPAMAREAFSRHDVQQYFFMKVLTGPTPPRLHPLWPAFDSEINLRHFHHPDDACYECEVCLEEIVGGHEELMREAEEELASQDERRKQ